MIGHYSCYKHKGHALIDCLIEKIVQDVMINHFQTRVQIDQDLEDEHNLMIILQKFTKAKQS
jgi:hypothetical protein